jgi:uncharacterized membrane protein YkvA (DUF1232 family)
MATCGSLGLVPLSPPPQPVSATIEAAPKDAIASVKRRMNAIIALSGPRCKRATPRVILVPVELLPYAVALPLALYAAIVLAFVVAGRRRDARAIARFVPDCVVLFSRLLRDGRLPRRHKLLVAALVPYLALPFDLIPDFVPVAGQLDDALLVAFVLRRVVRSRPDLIHEHWPGPQSSLAFVLRLAGGISATG